MTAGSPEPERAGLRGVMYRATFLDTSDLPFVGWTDGARWNGWVTPNFEFEVAKAIMEKCQVGEGYTMLYSQERDCFRLVNEHDPGDSEEWPGEDIDTPDGPKRTYAIGSWSWCWRLKEEDDG